MTAWLKTPLRVTRGGVLLTAVVLGLALGTLTAAAIDSYVEIGDQADENSNSIARLENLERPPTKAERAAIDRRLDRITKTQARRLLDLLLDASTPQQRRQLLPRGAGDTRQLGPNGTTEGAQLGIGDAEPGGTIRRPAVRQPTRTAPTAPAPTAGGSPGAPAPSPVRPGPLLQMPPLDLDGPGGLIPHVNLPPVTVPTVP